MGISIYLYVGSTVIECLRLEPCWHVIKEAPYFQIEISKRSLLNVKFRENIDEL